MRRRTNVGAITVEFETGRQDICIRVLFMEVPLGSVVMSWLSQRTHDVQIALQPVARLAMRVQTKLTIEPYTLHVHL